VGRQRDCGWIISFHDLVVARVDEILPFIFEIICESDDGCASVGMVPYLVMFSVIHTERKRLLRKCLEGSIYDTMIRETLPLRVKYFFYIKNYIYRFLHYIYLKHPRNHNKLIHNLKKLLQKPNST
jgi:hypothetical protein